MQVYHDLFLVSGSRSTFPETDPDPGQWYGSDWICFAPPLSGLKKETMKEKKPSLSQNNDRVIYSSRGTLYYLESAMATEVNVGRPEEKDLLIGLWKTQLH